MQVTILDTSHPANARYTIEILQAALERLPPGVQTPCECYGTLGDLARGEVPYVLELSKISHRLINMRLDGSELVGELVVLDKFPMGKVFKEILNLTPDQVRFEMRGAHHYDSWDRLVRFDLVNIAAVHAR